MALDLKNLRNVATEVNQLTQNWHLDKDDMWVGADKVPQEHDWYWITGDMSNPDDGYTAATSDEEARGPKEVVQAVCRHIQVFNPNTILELLDRIEELERDHK